MSKFDNISERNPHLEQMKEQGWAFVQTNGHGKYGAPHCDPDYAEATETGASTDESRIISWE